MMDEELKKNYSAELGERKVLDNGSVKYPVTIKCDEDGEVILETTYTVSKRQEERLEQMINNFVQKKAYEHENDFGEDKSNTKISL